jgi:hypothetical protein
MPSRSRCAGIFESCENGLAVRESTIPVFLAKQARKRRMTGLRTKKPLLTNGLRIVHPRQPSFFFG